MKRGTTFFLRMALLLIALLVLAIYIFVVPTIGRFAAELYPDYTYIKGLVWLDLYATAIPFYLALYRSYQLLGYIDRSEAFSQLAVRALRSIRNCAFGVSGLFAVGMPLYYLMADKDDAPGIIVIGLVIIFASFTIAVFAAVLKALLHEAIEIKTENELTV
ncbi:hypothetical protein B9G55_16880 [Saccharibacillus sp. O16]|nr:hypothetical protein B9G55_16880 [Saccharibacillus sp. O16]